MDRVRRACFGVHWLRSKSAALSRPIQSLRAGLGGADRVQVRRTAMPASGTLPPCSALCEHRMGEPAVKLVSRRVGSRRA